MAPVDMAGASRRGCAIATVRVVRGDTSQQDDFDVLARLRQKIVSPTLHVRAGTGILRLSEVRSGSSGFSYWQH